MTFVITFESKKCALKKKINEKVPLICRQCATSRLTNSGIRTTLMQTVLKNLTQLVQLSFLATESESLLRPTVHNRGHAHTVIQSCSSTNKKICRSEAFYAYHKSCSCLRMTIHKNILLYIFLS